MQNADCRFIARLNLKPVICIPQSELCNLMIVYPVTAPCDADETSFTYFANTPVV